MATTKKGTLAKPRSFASYWKHLRRYGKRAQAKAERAAAKSALSRSRP
jgi:hypothetical protein